jgi:hypothetical protein
LDQWSKLPYQIEGPGNQDNIIGFGAAENVFERCSRIFNGLMRDFTV